MDMEAGTVNSATEALQRYDVQGGRKFRRIPTKLNAVRGVPELLTRPARARGGLLAWPQAVVMLSDLDLCIATAHLTSLAAPNARIVVRLPIADPLLSEQQDAALRARVAQLPQRAHVVHSASTVAHRLAEITAGARSSTSEDAVRASAPSASSSVRLPQAFSAFTQRVRAMFGSRTYNRLDGAPVALLTPSAAAPAAPTGDAPYRDLDAERIFDGEAHESPALAPVAAPDVDGDAYRGLAEHEVELADMR